MKLNSEHLNRLALGALLFISVYHVISLLMDGSLVVSMVFLLAATLNGKALIHEQLNTRIQFSSHYKHVLFSTWFALVLMLYTSTHSYSTLGVWFGIVILSTSILLNPNLSLKLNLFGLISYWIFATFLSEKSFHYINTALGLSVLFLISQIIHKRISELEAHLILTQKTDRLTGCILPSNFQTELQKVVQLYERYKTPFSIIIIKYESSFNTESDLDLWLKELAHLYKSRLRKTDILCRFNTQKFMVLLPSTNIESAKTLAEDLYKCAQKYEFSFKKTSKNSPTLSFTTESYKNGEHLESWFSKIQSQ